MRLKLDENLGVRGKEILRGEGHNVTTVWEESLQAATDEQVAAQCTMEARALVTLDLDFANPLRFPPENTAGIAVLRLPSQPSHQLLLELVHTLAGALKQQDIRGKLWIVEPGRVRIRES